MSSEPSYSATVQASALDKKPTPFSRAGEGEPQSAPPCAPTPLSHKVGEGLGVRAKTRERLACSEPMLCTLVSLWTGETLKRRLTITLAFVKYVLSVGTLRVKALLALGMVLLALCDAQDLRAPLDPLFPSRLLTGVRRDGYTEYRVEFPSAYRSPYPANNTVYAWWLVPAERVGRAPTVVLLHSLGIRRPELEMGLARELARNGIAVFLMTLPYHMQRTPPGYGSGDLILAGDIALLREAGIQATWDVRRAVDWLQRQPEVDPDRIALVGISLGAILGATALASEPRLHSAALILGGQT